MDDRDARRFARICLQSFECARLLIKAKATVDLMAVTDATSHGVSPLCVACRLGRVDSVRLLLEAKAQVDLDNGHGATGLSACALGSTTQDDACANGRGQECRMRAAATRGGATIQYDDRASCISRARRRRCDRGTPCSSISVCCSMRWLTRMDSESEGTDTPNADLSRGAKGRCRGRRNAAQRSRLRRRAKQCGQNADHHRARRMPVPPGACRVRSRGRLDEAPTRTWRLS